jgi:hypothetical protein
MLDALGLREQEWQVYEALLAQPTLTLSQVAGAVGLDTVDTEVALAALEKRGLVSRSVDSDMPLVPAPPDVAIEALVARRQEGLERARLEAARLSERYRAGLADGDAILEVVRGRHAVVQRFEQLQRGAQREFHAFDKPPYATPHDAQRKVEESVLGQNVTVRGVYERSTLEDPAALALLEDVVRAGEEARVVEEVPMKLAIVDRRQALVHGVHRLDGAGGLLVQDVLGVILVAQHAGAFGAQPDRLGENLAGVMLVAAGTAIQGSTVHAFAQFTVGERGQRRLAAGVAQGDDVLAFQATVLGLIGRRLDLSVGQAIEFLAAVDHDGRVVQMRQHAAD